MDEPTFGDSGHHKTESGGSLFREASGINIHGGTFNAYGSGATEAKKRVADAMARLESRAEQGAPYDAAAREDVPKCHEHTRVAIIGGIHKWAHCVEPDAPPLMWMYGPAGSGKTTIMQTVAETFDEEGSLAASFFFSRLAASRPKEKGNFVITLAHQLSLSIPALEQPLADALSNSSILTKSLVKQLDALVIGPLKKLDATQIRSRCIFLIDGLDECEGDTAQRDVLDLLERFLHQARHRVRILIASRPLSHLQAFFSQANTREVAQTIPLDNDYQSDEDITSVFNSKFKEIRREHPSGGALPPKWPSQSAVDVLVKRASGQFIYASVVMKFIANHGRHPDDSLRTIISLKSNGDERPYEELDAVYTQVLSTVEPQNLEFVQTLMGCLLIPTEFHFADVAQNRATSSVDLLFMLQPGTTDARINRIYPLITATNKGAKFSHASFPEYLLDRSRSKEFFLDMRKVHCNLALCWFQSYSAHFRLHPTGGIVPNNVTGYKSPFLMDYYVTDGTDGRILLDLVRHCTQAEWSSELRQNIVDFDLHTALSGRPGTHRAGSVLWFGAFIWLSLIFWAEQHCFLSSADSEHCRGCLKLAIQSASSGLTLSPVDNRTVAILLTWWQDFARKDSHNYKMLVDNITDRDSVREYKHLARIMAWRPQIFDDHDDLLHEASYVWLCKTLAADVEMNGIFFSNGNLYADVILQLLRSRLEYWGKNDHIALMLTKASPSKELASFLVQNCMQLPAGARKRDTLPFFTAVLIYLFECGIPFISEHRHNTEFANVDDWVCGVCLLFDPSFGADFADIELSRDPAAGVQPLQIDEGDVPRPLQANPVHQFIPGVPLLWLQAWLLWLGDMVLRFFPVVA